MNYLNYIGKGLKCIDNASLAHFAKQDWVFSVVWSLQVDFSSLFVHFCQLAVAALGTQTPLESVLNQISRLCDGLADTLIWLGSVKAFYTRWSQVFFAPQRPKSPIAWTATGC